MTFKKTAIATFVATLLGASASAYAAYALPVAEPAPVDTGNWYFSAFGGASFTVDNNTVAVGNPRLKYEDVGFNAGAAFGYRSGPFRYEIQYMFDRITHKTIGGVSTNGETDLHAGFANVFYTFNSFSDYVAPYIGAGVGAAFVNPTKLSLDNDTVFAYQGGAGFTFSVDNDFDLDLGYRYVGTADVKPFTKRHQLHNVNLEVRYHIA